MRVYIDIESYSAGDLKKTGVYPYSEHASTVIVCIVATTAVGSPVLWVEGQALPEIFNTWAADPTVTWVAHNAPFEITMLNGAPGRAIGFPATSPDRWICTAVKCAAHGLPRDLDGAGSALNLGTQKDKKGHAIMLRLCRPRIPSKNNPDTRWTPSTKPEEFAHLYRYCEQDVLTTIAVDQAVDDIPADEQKLWELDYLINSRGYLIDVATVDHVIQMRDEIVGKGEDECQALTGGIASSQRAGILDWCYSHGVEMPGYTKADLVTALTGELPPAVQRVLEIRQSVGKVSTKKFAALARGVCADNRLRGTLMFYGAGTGRWCLAEGTRVMTRSPLTGNIREFPIEDVPCFHKVWDGYNWVGHDGVVCNGEREVIWWDGISATLSHEVWVSSTRKMTLEECRGLDKRIWRGKNGWLHKDPPHPHSPKVVRTYDILNAGPNNRFMANGRIVSNSGRIFQPQNLAQGTVKDVETAVQDLWDYDLESLYWLYGDPMQLLSSCIRPMIMASPGKELVVCDYASIEARIVQWAAGDNEALDVFRTGKDNYRVMAAEIYAVPYESIAKSDPKRQVGKQAILGLGYAMGWRKFFDTCQARGLDVDEALAKKVVDAFRRKYSKLKEFWGSLDEAARKAIKEPGELVNGGGAGLCSFFCSDKWLFLSLPSGRRLAYYQPTVKKVRIKTENYDFETEQINFMGQNSLTRQWEPQKTYGGSICENLVQAIARDIMGVGMTNLENAGHPVVLHVHDEAVCETLINTLTSKQMEDIMCSLPDWAGNLPIKAEGFVCQRYRK